MKCSRCGVQFRVDDAKEKFNSYFNYDLSYDSIFWEHLCGNCAINDIEGKIAEGMATVPDSDKPDSDDVGIAMVGNNDGTCANCGQSISRGSLTAPWEDGDNSYAYVRCPHCGCENIQ